MASNTPNLGLLKKDPVADVNETFNIQTMLNDNWDKIDEAVGNINVPEASLTEKGIVQLSNATNSTSENMAATPKAVKTAYDHADTVKTYVDNNFIKKSILLPEGTDMNTLMTEGEYYCPANVIVGTFKNTPDGQACYVKVSQHAGVNQTWYVFNPNDNRIFTRNYYPELGWGPWLTIINSSAPWQKRKLTEENGHCINVNNGNANNLTSTGFYVGENIANAPTTAPGAWWYIEVQAMSSDSWVVQIARDLFVQSGSYRTRIMYNGSWGPWSDDLFQSVANGKNSIASAISGKGVAASGSDDFETLSAKIRQISTGIQVAGGQFADGYARTISNLPFRPRILVINGSVYTYEDFGRYASGRGVAVVYDIGSGVQYDAGWMVVSLSGPGTQYSSSLKLNNVVFGANSVAFELDSFLASVDRYVVFGY